MADPSRPGASEPADPREELDLGVEDLPMEAETPRRAASAQLIVEGEVGSDAAMRDAMDPANQSLADALRLSYRVLQFVIVALLALFLVSGFQRVTDRQSGVMLRFGRIIEVGDHEALEPGLRRNLLPYPAGEFIIFDVEKRSVNLDNTFWPTIPATMTLDQAIERASSKSTLQPGQVGTVLTDGGDIAHLKLSATYDIIDPVRLVKRLGIDDADRVVELALDRAVVESTAGVSLQEFVEQPELIQERIWQSARALLTEMDCGIQLSEVHLLDTKPPFAIVKAYRELQTAREEARRGTETARLEAEEAIIDAAGERWRGLARLIDRYGQEQDRGNTELADEVLGEINALLESEETGGALADMIHRAQAAESSIELTLGKEARRFADLLPSYRQQPLLVSKRQRMEAVSDVFSSRDLEIIRVPGGLGHFDLAISGSDEIQKIRRELFLKRQEQRGLADALLGYRNYLQRTEDYDIGEANPLLEIGPDGKLRAKGSRR